VQRSDLRYAQASPVTLTGPSLAQTTSNYFYHTSLFCRYIRETERHVIDEFTPANILNYFASLEARKRWYVGVLSPFLQLWHSLGYHGVPASVSEILNELVPGGNPTGEAVLTHDPRKGPLSDAELEGVIAALQRSFELGETDLESFVLVWVLLATGRRTIQLAVNRRSNLTPYRRPILTPLSDEF